jgi:hypothetical protein
LGYPSDSDQFLQKNHQFLLLDLSQPAVIHLLPHQGGPLEQQSLAARVKSVAQTQLERSVQEEQTAAAQAGQSVRATAKPEATVKHGVQAEQS